MVWFWPLSAWSLIELAVFSFAVIIVLPPSTHKSLESFQRNPIPPLVASISIAPALSEPSIVPSSLRICIVWEEP